MPAFQALVLGLIQGLTEFIPVSSSGHLTLAPFFFGWSEPTLAFVVAAHIGTLVAVVWVFRERIVALLSALVGWRDAPEDDRRLLKMIVIATIPAGLVGAIFHSAISDSFERPVLVALLLGVTGYWLLASETIHEHRAGDPESGMGPLRDLDEVSEKDALGIGVAQAVAILPGISRSGATIGTGMRLGLTREAAAAFSFLLSIATIFGAAVFEIPDMLDEGAHTGAGAFVLGALAAGIAGFLSIRWFLGAIKRVGLRPFGVYCLLLMVAGLLTALARG